MRNAEFAAANTNPAGDPICMVSRHRDREVGGPDQDCLPQRKTKGRANARLGQPG